MQDTLGDRMKRYEKTCHFHLSPKMPVIIRLDGKSFHTFTRKCMKPFDTNMILAIQKAAFQTAREIQGFKFGYHQSDEISFLLTDYESINIQGWFDYDYSKIISLTSSLMTALFNDTDWCREYKKEHSIKHPPIFDARAFNMPESDIVNYFVWRAKDWERNSLNMYARSFFSHKELNNKNKQEMHEMLHKINKNWALDISGLEKNGTFFYSYKEQDKNDPEKTNSMFGVTNNCHANYEEIKALLKNTLTTWRMTPCL